jgi:hypothetical protein
MTITIHLPEETEKKLQRLAVAKGYADVTAYVQNLVEKEAHQDVVDLAEEFRRLAQQWQEETRYSSLAKRMAEHPAYRQIVAMGKKAVPLILAELEREPHHWFFALREITGADPVLPESRGKLAEMAAAWIQWGRQQGYQW